MSRSLTLRHLTVLTLVLGLCWATGTQADLAPATSDALTIMKAVHDRDAGDRLSARTRMTLTGAGPERVRTLLTRSMKFPGGRKQVILFDAPADIRGTGMLIVDYDDSARDDDQWLYLPSLRQTTRIASTRRSGAFVGSDFSFADLTIPDPARYKHTLLHASQKQDGEEFWVIESTPLDPSVEEQTGYSRAETWVSKRSLLPMRMKAAMRRGRTKYIALGGVRIIQGIATPSTVTARVVFEGKVESQTVLEQTDVHYDDPAVTAEEFSTQRLERGL